MQCLKEVEILSRASYGPRFWPLKALEILTLCCVVN